MNLPLKIGLTGGIGSGKTTVSRLFKSMGIPIYYADDAAKWLMQNDQTLINAIKKAFGATIYDNNNNLNRQSLANIVFNDKKALKHLESLVHPAVHQHGENWVAKQNHAPYVIKEAALTFESGSYKHLDKVITVFAPKKLRLQRVMQRDNVNASQVEARMQKQLPDHEKVSRADFVIYNDGTHLLIPQVQAIHHKLLALR